MLGRQKKNYICVGVIRCYQNKKFLHGDLVCCYVCSRAMYIRTRYFENKGDCKKKRVQVCWLNQNVAAGLKVGTDYILPRQPLLDMYYMLSLHSCPGAGQWTLRSLFTESENQKKRNML